MERTKSIRDSQSQALRQVFAQFDLETAINKIAVRCFNDLLLDHKHAFEYLNQNENRMGAIETRITKMQGFTESIESKMNSKMEVMKSLGDRLEVFNKQFFQNVKENQALIHGMRKDYDSLVSSTHKNTYQLRSVNNQLKDMKKKLNNTDDHIDDEINKLITKFGDSDNNLQQQIVQSRKQIDSVSTAFSEARAQLKVATQKFSQTIKDVELYKNQRLAIDRRIKDAVDEITTKSSLDEIRQMRLMFDSQIVTDRTNNAAEFTQLKNQLREQIENRSKEDQKMRVDAATKWGVQEKKNSQLKTMISQVQNDLNAKDKEMSERVSKVQTDLRQQLQTLSLRQVKDIQSLSEQINKINRVQKGMDEKVCDLQQYQKSLQEELAELNSTFLGLSDTVNGIIEQNQKRKKELKQLSVDSSEKDKLGNSLGDMNSSLMIIKEQLLQQRKETDSIKQQIDQISKRQDSAAKDFNSKNSKLNQLIQKEKQQNKNSLSEIHKKISSFTEELETKIKKAEKQAYNYTDALRQQLSSKLQMIEEVKKDMDRLKQAFVEQMKQTQRLNKALAQKMDRINAVMTKIKSDLTIKIQGAMSQLQRRGIQIKQITKLLDSLKKYLSYMNQGLSISLAVSLGRQVMEDPNGDPIKISSLLQGWIFDNEDKVVRYRCEHMHRKKLLCVALNFLANQGDKIKGSIMENGKEVFQKMMDETQIFTARKKVLSRRGGSQLPKLYL